MIARTPARSRYRRLIRTPLQEPAPEQLFARPDDKDHEQHDAQGRGLLFEGIDGRDIVRCAEGPDSPLVLTQAYGPASFQECVQT